MHEEIMVIRINLENNMNEVRPLQNVLNHI